MSILPTVGGRLADRSSVCRELTQEGVELADGHVLAPTRPGLGLTLRRDFARRITVPV